MNRQQCIEIRKQLEAYLLAKADKAAKATA